MEFKHVFFCSYNLIVRDITINLRVLLDTLLNNKKYNNTITAYIAIPP